MKRCVAVLLGTLLAALAVQGASDDPGAQADRKLGYGIGYQVGSDFRASGRALDPDAVVSGVRDALAGATPRWSADEMRDALRRLEQAPGTAPEADRAPDPRP